MKDTHKHFFISNIVLISFQHEDLRKTREAGNKESARSAKKKISRFAIITALLL